jgi:hypothetical protein
MTAGAALRDFTHCGEEALGFAFGEHRGRLVENENARARNQHLDDLDALLLGDRQCIHAPRRIEREAERLGLFPDFRARWLQWRGGKRHAD